MWDILDSCELTSSSATLMDHADLIDEDNQDGVGSVFEHFFLLGYQPAACVFGQTTLPQVLYRFPHTGSTPDIKLLVQDRQCRCIFMNPLSSTR